MSIERCVVCGGWWVVVWWVVNSVVSDERRVMSPARPVPWLPPEVADAEMDSAAACAILISSGGEEDAVPEATTTKRKKVAFAVSPTVSPRGSVAAALAFACCAVALLRLPLLAAFTILLPAWLWCVAARGPWL